MSPRWDAARRLTATAWERIATALIIVGVLWMIWFTISPFLKPLPPCHEVDSGPCRFD